MARPPGSKNKRTLIREQRRILAAAGQAEKTAMFSSDPRIIHDAMEMMEAGMRFFHGLVLIEQDKKDKADAGTIRQAWLDAIQTAEKLIPFKYARLASIKLAGKLPGEDDIDKSASAAELRAQIIAQLAEVGIPVGSRGVANRRPN